MPPPEPLKLYFDYKSPFAYLAKDPAFALPDRYAVTPRWIPFVLRIKGKGERSVYSEHKARYSYLDARRWANRRGGFRIMGPPCQREAAEDHVFGVPLFVFRGEPFWGHDRMPLLEERLAEAGLGRTS